MRLDIYIHVADDKPPVWALEILRLLGVVIHKEDKIMGKLEDAQQALQEIDEATTQAGEQQVIIADALAEISTDIDTLISESKDGQLTPELVANMQAKSARVKAIGDKLKEHADFAKAIASKSPTEPVPVPVPDPLPEA